MAHPIPLAFQSELDSYADQLRRRFGPRLRAVRLFGSWARGEAGPDSDVDVAVVIDGMTADDWREAVALAADAELQGGQALDPMVLSGERFDELQRQGRRLAADLLREGIPL